MDWKQQLINARVDVNDAIQSFSNKEERYVKYLKLFSTDKNFDYLQDAISKNACHEAFEYCHTLKGVVGNLYFRGMYSNICEACEILRVGKMTGVDELIKAVEPNYRKIIGIINNM